MEKLLSEITAHSQKLPEEVQQEILDFIKFKELKLAEQREKFDAAILSESSLSDWDSPEEDEAWKNFQ